MLKQLSKAGKTAVAAQGSSRTGPLPCSSTFSSRFFSSKKHTEHNADTYAKDDTDTTPPKEDIVFRVDSASENVQRPTEPLSGEWSRAGAKTSEYESADNTLKTKEGHALRYGGKESLQKDKGAEMPKQSSGPEADSKHGRP